jgi:hypothetical protein
MAILSSLYLEVDIATTEMEVKLTYICTIDVTIPFGREAEIMTLATEMLFWEHIVQS